MESRSYMFSTAKKRSTMLENKVIQSANKISPRRRLRPENRHSEKGVPRTVQRIQDCKLSSAWATTATTKPSAPISEPSLTNVAR